MDTQRLIQPHLQLASLHLLRPPPAAPQPPPHSQAGAREREYSIGVVLTKIGASTRESRRREGRKRSAGIEGYFPPRSRGEGNNEKTVGNKRSNCSGSAAVVGGGTRQGAAAQGGLAPSLTLLLAVFFVSLDLKPREKIET